jgi:TolB-like protein/DNA-binding winged helix-turn-helix (wHTH) protein/Flp pilus assembly protein TadD
MTVAGHLRFGAFELDLGGGALYRGRALVRLEPQPLKVLLMLADRAGQLVSRQEIQKEVWQADTFVDFDQGLNYCVRQIREALGDSAGSPQFIETVPRRGYRFVAPLEARRGGRVLLAVLPFENVGGDAEKEYFSDGLTEEMIARVGRLNPHRLGVIARTSAMCYKRTTKGIDAIGRELGVAYVLEGSVRQIGSRVRVTAQLVQVTDQTPVWTDTFERSVGDILALQSEIAQAIATRVGIELTPRAQHRPADSRAIHSDAYDAYLKGRYFWKRRSRAALQKSAEYFTRAIVIDPSYAPAYSGLADVHLTQLDYNYLRPRDAFALAEQALHNALRLDDTLAEPHTSLGHLRLHQFNWDDADRAFGRSLDLNQGYDAAHYFRANLLAAFGRFDEAIAEATRTIELDPMTANTRQNRAFILYLARRYDEAVREAVETLEMDPAHTSLLYYLGLAHVERNAFGEAFEAFARIGPRSQAPRGRVLAAIAYARARAGDRAAALEDLTSLEASSQTQYVSSYETALVYMALGQTDRAFELLATAHDEFASALPFVSVDPRCDDVRDDERFRGLIRRLGLSC